MRAVFNAQFSSPAPPNSLGARLQVEHVMVLFRNMMYLANLLRPHQARATLLAVLQRDLERRRAAAAELRQLSSQAQGALEGAVAKLERAASAGAAAAGAAGPREVHAMADGDVG